MKYRKIHHEISRSYQEISGNSSRNIAKFIMKYSKFITKYNAIHLKISGNSSRNIAKLIRKSQEIHSREKKISHHSQQHFVFVSQPLCVLPGDYFPGRKCIVLILFFYSIFLLIFISYIACPRYIYII